MCLHSVEIENSVEYINLHAESSYRATTQFVNNIINGGDNNSFKILCITGHCITIVIGAHIRVYFWT